MPKRKDWLIIALVIALAALMLGASKLLPRTDLSTKTADVTLAPDAIEYVTPEPASETTQAPTDEPAQAPTDEPTSEPTEQPTQAPADEPAAEPEQEAAVIGPMPSRETEKVRGYVVLTVGNRQYGDPIPMDRDKIITLRQEDGKVNKVHITPEKVYMESSTCENQDCVGQGEVHIDTYEDRILGTYIICLPNNVSIEMVPAE